MQNDIDFRLRKRINQLRALQRVTHRKFGLPLAGSLTSELIALQRIASPR